MGQVNIDVQTINLVTGILIPILVGLVSKKVASSTLKSLTNFFLSAVSGGLALIVSSGPMTWNRLIISIMTTFVTSVAVYYGVWKATGVTQTVQDKTANFGIGKAPVVPKTVARKRTVKPKT